MAKEYVPNNVRVISDHVIRFARDKEIFIVDEIESEVIHSDIFVIKPNWFKRRNYYTLLSCGLASQPMTVPIGMEDYRLGEISMLLPKGWKVQKKYWENENNWWPFRLLQALTKFPHTEKTWFGYGHTFSWGLEETFSENNQFVGVILLNSRRLSTDFCTISSQAGIIHIWAAYPLYREELELKMEFGTDKLLEKFEMFDVCEIVDINRANTCR